MKRARLYATTFAVAGLLAASASTFAAGGNAAPGARSGGGLTPLSDAEVASLKWLREEEKLARDVYLELNAYWPAKIFLSIADSEQSHFDAIGRKLVLYGIADPALPGIGVFSDPELQALHDELLAIGMPSSTAALGVGVTIEETDIEDLEAAIDGTDSRPLTQTYEHLMSGSERHLQSFLKALGLPLPD